MLPESSNELPRRDFLKKIGILGAAATFPFSTGRWPFSEEPPVSDFARRLEPVGRILEEEGYYVWCNSPIFDPEGKVHVFYSRWPERYGMSGWIHQSEIAHAIADSPESGFVHQRVVLAPRPGFFDATTCHNPSIHLQDGVYYLFYMGNSNGKTNTKRIGLATATSLYGPWTRRDTPLLDAGLDGAWDDHCTTNPAYLRHPSGASWLYYKSWNTAEYEQAVGQKIRGNRKYGLATALQPDGPYSKIEANPVIDFSRLGANQQLEDASVWYEKDKFRLIARDMGFYDHSLGLYFESADGIQWPQPTIAYYGLNHYVQEPLAPKHLTRYGRLERPQLLLKKDRPVYLFGASQGGAYMTSSAFLFKVRKTPKG